jgi:hypothetical protein
MLNLCSELHSPVVHDTHQCPVCAAIEERDEVLRKLDEKTQEVVDLNTQISNMRGTL